MDKKAPVKVLVNTISTVLLGAVMAASTTVSASESLKSGVNVTSIVASQVMESRPTSGFTWDKHSPASTDAVVAGRDRADGFRWNVSSNTQEVASTSVNSYSSPVSRPQGFIWGIRSAAEHEGFIWGIRSTAEQKGFIWGIRSTPEQQGFIWGIRGAAEQKGFIWGIRNAAEQSGFIWGIRNATEQQGFIWGIR